MQPEDEQFQEDIEAFKVIFDRMIEAGLIVRHGHSDKGKLIGAHFTPDGQHVVTMVATLDHALGPLTPKQILMFWSYMVSFAEKRGYRGPGDERPS